jgi:SM-20-related protein
MESLTLLDQLGLFVRRGFLSGVECMDLRQEMSRSKSIPATVIDQSGERLDPYARSTHWVAVGHEIKRPIQQRIAALQPEIEEHFRVTLSHMEEHYLLYKPGDFFHAHRDSQPDAANTTVAQRKVSAILFLNDAVDEPRENAYCGGALTLYGMLGFSGSDELGLSVKGEAGLLVAFRSDTLHNVTAITNGERYTVAVFFR